MCSRNDVWLEGTQPWEHQTREETRDMARQAQLPTSPLSRIAGPLAVVTGALVVATQIPTFLYLFTGGDLTSFVLGPVHGITSVLSIVAFGLLVLALVADLRARGH